MALVPAQRVASAATGVGDGRSVVPTPGVGNGRSRVPTPSIQRPVTRGDVYAALAAMSAEHRRVVVEMYYHRRSVAETADMLGIGESRVAALAYRAVCQLPRTLAAVQSARAVRPRSGE